jgi:hypothetical protein
LLACLGLVGKQGLLACSASKNLLLLIKSSESYLLIQQGFSLTIYA